MEIPQKLQRKSNNNLLWVLLIGFAVACSLAYIFKAKDSDKKGENITIKIPEKSGEFKAAKPLSTLITGHALIMPKTLGKTSKNSEKSTFSGTLDQNAKNDSINAELLLQNEILRRKFKEASDSLKIAKYDKAIELSDFSKSFDNDTIKVDVFGKVRGEVQYVGVKWKIKASEQKVNVKTYRILANGEIGSNTRLDRFGAKAGLIYQSPNGRQYPVSYDNNGVIWVGTSVTIFKYTKSK